MVDMKLWELVKFFRDALIQLSNGISDLLGKPLLSLIVFPKKIVIFGFDLSAWFTNLILSNDVFDLTLLEILIGGGLATIVGLVMIKKLIPIA